MVNKVNREAEANQEEQKFLAKVPEEYVFRCHDGKVLSNMKELYEAISAMTDEISDSNWNKEKNDFSNWVRYVIGDVKLAGDLEKATSRSLAAWEVATRLAYLARHMPQIRRLKIQDRTK